MLTHHDLWCAIERFAAAQGMTCSGMARKCGLDSTTFNKSKRYSPYGQPRWPSLGTLAKVLNATNTPIHEFVHFIPEHTDVINENTVVDNNSQMSGTHRENF